MNYKVSFRKHYFKQLLTSINLCKVKKFHHFSFSVSVDHSKHLRFSFFVHKCLYVLLYPECTGLVELNDALKEIEHGWRETERPKRRPELPMRYRGKELSCFLSYSHKTL